MNNYQQQGKGMNDQQQGNTYSSTVSNPVELPNEKDTRNIKEEV